MSRWAWLHKSRSDRSLETWNLPELPDGFLAPGNKTRMYVAIERHWRGYFLLKRLIWTPSDGKAPFCLAFAPSSWTAIDPVPAPPRIRAQRCTLDVPKSNTGTR